MQSNLDSLQSTIRDLKQIIESSHGSNVELCQLVKQLESVVADMQAKTRTQKQTAQTPALPIANFTPGISVV